MATLKNPPPICSYCGQESKLVDGSVIYPHRPDLRQKKFWHCKPCKAYVGCHPKSDAPLGRLANAELRMAKMEAHFFFDEWWQSKKMSRSQAYARLAACLGIPEAECHIGMFDLSMCRKVVKVCSSPSFLEESAR